jgi:hypothetical protein
MIEMGIVVGIGLLMTLVKASWHWKMRMLSNPLIVDVIVLALLLLVHWGTFSGVMVATIGAMVASLTLSGARWLYGYVMDGTYVPGYFDIGSKLV